MFKYRLADFSDVSEVGGEWLSWTYYVDATIARTVEAADKENVTFADNGITSAVAQSKIRLRFKAKPEAEHVMKSMRLAREARAAFSVHPPATGGAAAGSGYVGDRVTMPAGSPIKAASERNIVLASRRG